MQSDALRIRVEMQANPDNPMPVFVATCGDPELSVTGRTLDELRINLERAISDSLSQHAEEDGTLAARPVFLEFAA
jgi:hypothetical protein